MQPRERERGYIDNRPVFVIILIIGAIAATQYLKYLGIEPVALWERVPSTWRSLFWSTVAFIFFGAIVAAVTVTADERREPFRVEGHGDRRVIVETARALHVICVLLVLFGLMLAGFGLAGSGWFSWLVLALGFAVGLSGATTLGIRKRFVVERGRVLLNPQPVAGEAAPAQVVRVERTSSGGAFGQPYVEHHIVRVDDREVLDAPYAEKADKLAAALKQAIEETAPGRSA